MLHLVRLHFDGSQMIRGAGEEFWLVVEVSPEQQRHLKRIPMTALETLVFLGAGLPGVYDDLVRNGTRAELRR